MNHIELSIVLPVYNEESIIAQTLMRVFRFFSQFHASYEIIAVLDAPEDNTLDHINSIKHHIPHLRIIRLPINMGKGYAVQQGVLAARGDWVLFTDVDLATPLESYTRYIPYTADYDIIIGSRGLEGSHIFISQPRYKVFLGKLGNRLVRLTLSLPFHDTQCGFKLFKRNSTLSVFQQQRLTRWGFDFEILYIAMKKQLSIKELPVDWSDDGNSSVKKIEYFNTLRDLFVVKLNDIRGLYK